MKESSKNSRQSATHWPSSTEAGTFHRNSWTEKLKIIYRHTVDVRSCEYQQTACTTGDANIASKMAATRNNRCPETVQNQQRHSVFALPRLTSRSSAKISESELQCGSIVAAVSWSTKLESNAAEASRANSTEHWTSHVWSAECRSNQWASRRFNRLGGPPRAQTAADCNFRTKRDDIGHEQAIVFPQGWKLHANSWSASCSLQSHSRILTF